MSKLKTFVVEDNALILENLCAILLESHLAEIVGSADSELAALNWLSDESHHCDVVLIDIFLKKGNGLGVLKSIRDLPHKPQRVVVFTNHATPDMRAQCTEWGAHEVFDKSNQMGEMLAWFTGIYLVH